MASIKPPDGVVTLMFTDIVGSTALRDRLVAVKGQDAGDVAYRKRYLQPHNKRIRALLKKHRGFEVKTNGDSFMICFARPADAIRCATAIQRSLGGHPITTDDPGSPLAIRIGIHTGEATLMTADGRPDYDGHAVNIASRVENLLKGGERVYCSGETAVLAKALPKIRYHKYGPYQLKGVSEKVEIVDVLWHAALKPAPPEQPNDRLPYPWLTHWIGRAHEMTALKSALRVSHLVTLHGIGGVGKTRLAVETLLARGGGLPREIIFVSLELTHDTPEGLLGAIRDALGLTEVHVPNVEALCRQLHGGDRLLLLDNFESVKSAAKIVPRIAATAGVRVLVTSQHRLNLDGERVVELSPMPAKGDLTALESYRLFIDRAQQHNASWRPNDVDAMSELLAATDGLPYLIQIVAALTPQRTLRQLAYELKMRLMEVRARGEDESRPQRHASVQASLELALGRLPTAEREALPRLAIFAGGFDAEGAEAVATATAASLDTLVDASLLEFDSNNGRYSMLGTTSAFLREIVRADEWSCLVAAHGRWFIAQLESADAALRAMDAEKQAATQRWIGNELENMQQAVAWAGDHAPELFERSVPLFYLYLIRTYRFSEIVRLNEALLHQLSLEIAPQSWASAQNRLGVGFGHLPTGDQSENLARAIACFESALCVWTERDFPASWAQVQTNLGIAYRDLPTGDRGKNLTRAIGCYEAALRVYNERDFPVDWARMQVNLGMAHSELPAVDREENLARAIGCYEAALRVYNERQFPVDWATTQNSLGIAFTYQNLPSSERGKRLRRAIGCYNAALGVRTERDFPVEWAATQNNLAIAYTLLPARNRGENFASAIGFYEAALRVFTEVDFPAYWAKAHYNLGCVYQELATDNPRDHRRHAIACFKAAARGYSKVGFKREAKVARERSARLANL